MNEEDFKIDEKAYAAFKGRLMKLPRHVVLSEAVKDASKRMEAELERMIMTPKGEFPDFKGLKKTLETDNDLVDVMRYTVESLNVEPGCDFKELIKEL